MIGLIQRRAPESDNGVPFELIYRTLVLGNDVAHGRKVFVEQSHEPRGGELLGDAREACDVGEKGGHLPLFPAQGEARGILHQNIHYLRRQVLAKGITNEGLLPPLHEVEANIHEHNAQNRRDPRIGHGEHDPLIDIEHGSEGCPKAKGRKGRCQAPGRILQKPRTHQS